MILKNRYPLNSMELSYFFSFYFIILNIYIGDTNELLANEI